MIDRDNYEGHSTEYSYEIVSIDDDKEMDATYALLNDAPLLLAEVKRLREQGRKLIEAAERVRSDISDQDTGWYYQLGNHIQKMNRLVIE